jgi:hypothetical protein
MLPTLFGRIQTRIFAVAVIGTLWAQIIVYVLPGGGTTTQNRKAMYGVLLIVGVVGVLWELVYHGLMQFRWEKDWPTLFGLLTFVNEGLIAYLIAHSSLLPWTEGIAVSTFAVGFLSTWIVLWLFFNGPMRIFTVHWRFRGGRLL